jgi:hypothetical protein
LSFELKGGGQGGLKNFFPSFPSSLFFYTMHSTLVKNHGCTSRSTDPLLNGADQYDFAYIEKTVYELASMDDFLGRAVKEALTVIEQAYKLYG